jgi:hypothetical protein
LVSTWTSGARGANGIDGGSGMVAPAGAA